MPDGDFKGLEGAMINDLLTYQEQVIFLDLKESKYKQLKLAEEKEQKEYVYTSVYEAESELMFLMLL